MPFLTLISKIRKFVATPVLLGALLVVPVHVLASTYGSGGYSNCTYSQGCSSSGAAPSSASTPAATDQSTPILLNDFSDYFTDSGKQLTLSSGQSVALDIVTNGVSTHFIITVSTVGDDYVDLSIPLSSITDRISVGQTKEYDLNGDGKPDIKITLNSITGGKANLTFGTVLGASTTIQPKESSPATTPTKHHSWLGLILSIVAIVVALFIFLLLWWRHRKRQQQPGPWTTGQ